MDQGWGSAAMPAGWIPSAAAVPDLYPFWMLCVCVQGGAYCILEVSLSESLHLMAKMLPASGRDAYLNDLGL